MTSSLTRNFRNNTGKIIPCLLLGTLLLTGCEGPSTTVLQNNKTVAEEEPLQLSFDVPESSAERLSQTVETLCNGENGNMEDPDTTQAASDPSVYIVSALRNSSYDVNQTGEIIEAVLRSTDDSDICLVIACYGGSAADICASDEAAGAAVLLETAQILSDFSGDTEIHFIFLPGLRSDVEYIYTYLTEMFTPNPDRLIGTVILGGLGLNGVSENELGCVYGKETFMAEQINRICEADIGRKCRCTESSFGLQNALQRNLIPSVAYRQKENVEAGTVLDCPALIDYDNLCESTDILCRTLALLLGDTTPSMQARAHYTDASLLADAADYRWDIDDPMPFGESEKTLEGITGLLGGRTKKNVINNGKELLEYRFYMKYFDDDEVLPADFYYLSDALQSVQIRAFEAGRDYMDMHDDIKRCIGESTDITEGPYGTAYEWTLPMQRTQILLQPQRSGFELSLTEYDTPISLYASDSLGCSRLRSLFEQVIPEDEREVISFEAYTDGYGATYGRLTETGEDTADQSWVMGLDLDDALDKNAVYKDKFKTISELVSLYGEYLAETDKADIYDGYNSRFGGGIGDFAASFCLFSLSDTPRVEAGPAADPIRYFHDFDELENFRETVRNIR